MDSEMALLTPQKFENFEIEAAKKLRIKLSEILPADFDSDFFLARWFRAYKDDEKGLELKLKELIEHRRAFGYNFGNIVEKSRQLEFAKKTFERFHISQLKMDVYSENVAVFIQKMDGCDLKEITKVIPLSYVLHSYFILHESFQRSMAKKETETGKPAAVAVVLDLKGLCLTDFLNPLSGPSKLARLVVKIWSDYFTENMITLFLMHPPGVLSVMWQLTKHIVDAKTQSRMVFITKTEDIFKYLKPESIPVEWGGTRRDDSGFSNPPESCCQRGIRITHDQYFDRISWWMSLGFRQTPELKAISVKAKSVFEIQKEVEEGQFLIWEFTTSSDFTFEIVRIISKSGSPASLKENLTDLTLNNDEETIWPKITLTSLKVSEHGSIVAKHSGNYIFRWENPSSSWLNAKLHCIAEIFPK